MKKVIAKLLIKIGTALFKFSHWLENTGYDIPAKLADCVLDISRKLCPKLFCSHCGVVLERCRYGGGKPPYKWHCCNCESSIK